MAYENLIITENSCVKVLTINRPKALNALNKSVLLELRAALLDIIHETNGTKALVITGGGDRSFVAGADIAHMRNLSPLQAESLSSLGHRVLDLIGRVDIPVIAAVNGYALGGGLELALACDFIYVNKTAVLGLVETSLALIPGFGGIYRLARAVGIPLAKEMIFSASKISADEALRIGLVNKVCDGDVLKEAVALSKKIAKNGPYAISAAKKLLEEGQDMSKNAANAFEKKAFGLTFSTADSTEGISAFLEKRYPMYEGK